MWVARTTQTHASADRSLSFMVVGLDARDVESVGTPLRTVAAGSNKSPIGGEVLPYPFNQLRIDRPRVWLRQRFLRVQHEFEGLAVRPERLGIEDVEAFADGVGLGHTLLEGERVDGGHLDIPAKDQQPGEPWLEMLDRRHGDALCIRSAARPRR